VSGRAQFMGEHGDELVLGAIGFAGFGAEDIFQGDGGHLGELDEDGFIIGSEVAGDFCRRGK